MQLKKHNHLQHLQLLQHFISEQQLYILTLALNGEEGQYFKVLIDNISNIIETMPKTYEQDGKGNDAIAYLHYFNANMDFYITEKDMCKEQLQAYGLADLGYGAELGYISIKELIDNNLEIDLHFNPKPLKELNKNI